MLPCEIANRQAAKWHPPGSSGQVRIADPLRFPIAPEALTLSLLFLGGLALAAQSPAPAVVPRLQRAPALVLTERKCVACHRDERFGSGSTGAPDLRGVGSRVSTEYLRSLLSTPPAARSGSSMPYLLGAVPEAERAAARDELVAYLRSLGGAPAEPVVLEEGQMAAGKRLYGEVGCVACHGPDPKKAAEDDVPLPPLAAKWSRDGLVEFLRDPAAMRPGTTMPSLKLEEVQARAIAAHLLAEQLERDSKGDLLQKEAPGLVAFVYEGTWSRLPAFDALTPSRRVIVPRAELPPERPEDAFALRLRGALRVDTPGEYQFFLNSDDGSQLWIDGHRVIDNDGEHPPVVRSGKVNLKEGEHGIDVRFFEIGGGEALRLEWEGPGIARSLVPADRYSHRASRLAPRGFDADEPKPEQAAAGRHWFEKLACAQCHPDPSGAPTPAPVAKPLRELMGAKGGCLERSPGGTSKTPQFDLSTAETEAVSVALAELAKPSALSQDRDIVDFALERLRCLSCHRRGDIGGPSERLQGWFTSLGEAELGDEGRIPPALTGVGRKLRKEWIDEVLAGRGVARPYMATRMPNFEAAHVAALPDQLERIDRPASERSIEFTDHKLAGGQALAGTGAMACIQCHRFAGHESLGIPAMDLALTYRRLRFDWFRDYLLDPGKLRPGTRMPAFFPEGKSTVRTVLDGSTEAQIEALWCWLSLGESAPMPKGLKLLDDLEVFPKEGPIVFRTFLDGVGARAICVGFPEGIHAAFDAETCRMGIVWKGRFVSAEPSWVARAGRFAMPLGQPIIELAAGLPRLSRRTSNDTFRVDPATPRWVSYEQHKNGKVRFEYAILDISIVEEISTRATLGEVALVRRITVTAPSDVGRISIPIVEGAQVSNVATDAAQRSVFRVDGGWRVSVAGAPRKVHAVTAVPPNKLEVSISLDREGDRWIGTAEIEVIP